MTPLTADSPEPAHGSVLLRHGATGTAYQRLYRDGLYHSTTGAVTTFAGLFEGINPPKGSRAPAGVLLIHDAAEHES